MNISQLDCLYWILARFDADGFYLKFDFSVEIIEIVPKISNKLAIDSIYVVYVFFTQLKCLSNRSYEFEYLEKKNKKNSNSNKISWKFVYYTNYHEFVRIRNSLLYVRAHNARSIVQNDCTFDVHTILSATYNDNFVWMSFERKLCPQ